MAVAVCPDANTLSRFVAGTLADDDSAPLEEHVLACGRCAESVGERALADPLLAEARAARNAPPPPPAVRLLADRIRQLADAPGTHTAAATPPAARPVSRTHLDFMDPPVEPNEIGRLGGYRLLSVLGEGGMGTVFLADDPQAGRQVAVKTLRPELAADPSARARFLREARAAAGLEHQHVVPVYHVGEQRGVPWLVMPLLRGESLADRLKRERVPPVAEAIRLTREAALGLSAAHEKGLVHRDIKPGNLWLDDRGGRLRVLDFGLARAAEGGTELTTTGAIVGTPAYMAPEQIECGKVDGRADVWSLGVTLYRMLTGETPFRGKTPSAILAAVLADDPAAPAAVNPAVPAWLSALVLRMLAKDPARRPATMAAVVEELAAGAVAEALPGRSPDSKKTPRPRRRWAESVVMSALALVTLAVVALPAVVVIIRDKDGNEWFRGKVPEGGSISIQPDDTKPAPPPATKWGYPDGPPPLKAPFTAEEAAESQKKWAAYMKCPVETEVDLGKGQSLTVVLIPPGKFVMGSPPDETNVNFEPQHQVTIPRPFWIGKTEVTQGQWLAVNKRNRSDFSADSENGGRFQVAGLDTTEFPVDSVLWEEADGFCQAVAKRLGKWKGRLPTEAQWEWACRAGTTTPFNIGDTLDETQANILPKKFSALKEPPADARPVPVGSFPKFANAFGLLDMHGNVQEWCSDFEGDYPAPTPAGGKDGPEMFERRNPQHRHVIRGGTFKELAVMHRSGRRETYPNARWNANGFRVCLVID